MKSPSEVSSKIRRLAAVVEMGKFTREQAADALKEVIASINEHESAERDVPKTVERYVKEITKNMPNYTEAQCWATAWKIYCENHPDSPHCK